MTPATMMGAKSPSTRGCSNDFSDPEPQFFRCSDLACVSSANDLSDNELPAIRPNDLSDTEPYYDAAPYPLQSDHRVSAGWPPPDNQQSRSLVVQCGRHLHSPGLVWEGGGPHRGRQLKQKIQKLRALCTVGILLDLQELDRTVSSRRTAHLSVASLEQRPRIREFGARVLGCSTRRRAAGRWSARS